MYILVNVPYLSFFPAPLIGIPHLLGILDSNKIQNEFIDINAHYYKYLFSEEGISALIQFFNDIAYVYKNKNQSTSWQNAKVLEILEDDISPYYKSLFYIKKKN